jgi:hypothetical protein
VADHTQMKLGRLAPKPEAQRKLLKLASYVANVPDPPVERDWLAAVTNPGEMLNDSLGDCTCAALGHLIQIWSANSGQQIDVPDAAVLAAYKVVGKYVDGDPSTDNGAVVTDVLSLARTVGIGGYLIDAFVGLDQRNEKHIKQGIDLFGAVDIGLDLPITAQTQDVWAVDLGAGEDSRRGSWGGHSVIVGAYDADGLTCITWGEKKRMTWQFWNDYTSESYAMLGSLWVNAKQLAPSRFDLVTLKADLAAVAS